MNTEITKPENPEVSQILGCVISLLHDSNDWLRDVTARDLLDKEVSAIHEGACKFSLVGAIHRVVYAQELTPYWSNNLLHKTMLLVLNVIGKRYHHVVSEEGIHMDSVSLQSSMGQLRSVLNAMNDITSFDHQKMMEFLMTSMWMALAWEDEAEDGDVMLRVSRQSLIDVHQVLDKFEYDLRGNIKRFPPFREVLDASDVLHKMIHQI